MRILALIGTCFFTAGIYLFTRGTAWHYGYMLSGTVVGLLGLLLLGLSTSTAPHASNSLPARRAKAKNRLRPRSSTGIRSLRMRRNPVGAAGGK